MTLRKKLITGFAGLATMIAADYAGAQELEVQSLLPASPFAVTAPIATLNPRAATNNQYQQDRKYEAQQIHNLVGMLNFPQFPLSTACITQGKKGFLGYKKGSPIARIEGAEFLPASGMGFIDTRDELYALARGIATCYQPKFVDPSAFDDLAVFAGVPEDFARWLENTRDPNQPTQLDILAQFARQYQLSLKIPYKNFPGVVAYQTPDNHLHVTGHTGSIKQLKEKIR